MFPEILLLFCFQTSLFFLLDSSLPLQLDVARYACVKKTGNLLDNKT